MTPYQLLLLCVLVTWPIAIACLLVLMSRLEDYVARANGTMPEEAQAPDREVKIVFGDTVVGEPDGEGNAPGEKESQFDTRRSRGVHSRATHSTSTRAPFGNAATPTVARAGGSDPKNSS